MVLEYGIPPFQVHSDYFWVFRYWNKEPKWMYLMSYLHFSIAFTEMSWYCHLPWYFSCCRWGWEGRESSRNTRCEPGPGHLGLFSQVSVYTVQCQHLSKSSPALKNMSQALVRSGPRLPPASAAVHLAQGIGVSFVTCWVSSSQSKNKQKIKTQKPGCVAVVQCLPLRTSGDWGPML